MNFCIYQNSLTHLSFHLKQRTVCKDENKSLLSEAIECLRKLSIVEPVVGENACRSMLEALFTSTRQSLKEFLASISASHPIVDEEGDLYDFDELDTKKLDLHIGKQVAMVKEPAKIPSHREYRSEIACILLDRWKSR